MKPYHGTIEFEPLVFPELRPSSFTYDAPLGVPYKPGSTLICPERRDITEHPTNGKNRRKDDMRYAENDMNYLNNLTKWDNRFLDLAQLVASWSKDDSTKVGACIVDTSNRVVSLGYNGPPQSVRDGFKDRDQKLRRTIHAEANALAFANRDVNQCTLYVTHPPCAHCAAMIIQRGISRVVFIPPSQGFAERWVDDMAEAKDMFREAGVMVVGYEP